MTTQKHTYRADFGLGKILTRKSPREYTHAYVVFRVQGLDYTYIYTGFAGSERLADNAARSYRARCERNYPDRYYAYEVVPVTKEAPKPKAPKAARVPTAKPHVLLQINRPDEVAETFSTVEYGSELYLYLWNVLVPLAERPACIEDCGPSDVIGIGSVGSLWRKIPAYRRAQLNRIAAEEDAKREREWAELAARDFRNS